MSERCNYCWRPGVTVIVLRRGALAALLKRPRPTRRVCPDHIRSDSRNG